MLKTGFNDYFIKNRKSIHKSYNHIINDLPNDIKDINNLILFGPPGIGKYTIALKIINKFSPSNLNYFNKITITEDHDKVYNIIMSDIHFEIDINLLGVNSKTLMNNIINNIADAMRNLKLTNAFILCKNFHLINYELHEIFYSYLQKNMIFKNIHFKFIFLTENLSFIDKNIKQVCNSININRPKKLDLIKDTQIIQNYNQQTNNINELLVNNKNFQNDSVIIKELKTEIINSANIDFSRIREILYDILIYQMDVYKVFYNLLKTLYNDNIIDLDNLNIILNKLVEISIYYNNNYRPIFHLEIFILTIIKHKNEI
jgi:hypothetical protein